MTTLPRDTPRDLLQVPAVEEQELRQIALMILNKGNVAFDRIGSEVVGDAGMVKKQIKNYWICGQQ